jgi:hypothetical protein
MGSKKYGKPSSAILRIASSCDFLFPESFCNELFYTSEEAGSVKVSDIADVPCKKECRENVRNPHQTMPLSGIILMFFILTNNYPEYNMGVLCHSSLNDIGSPHWS